MGKPLPIDAAHRVPKALVKTIQAAGDGSYSTVVLAEDGATWSLSVGLSSLEVGELIDWDS
jgi:hypothetical protein